MYILNLWFGLRFGFFGRFKVRFENTNLGSEGTGSSRFGIFRFVPNLLEMVPLYICSLIVSIFQIPTATTRLLLLV